MKSTLHVKNFGPIKDAKLELSNVNVLIGPQASGKSTLAKLYTICKSPSLFCTLDGSDKRFISNDVSSNIDITLSIPSFQQFINSVIFYSMDGYWTNQTEIYFTAPSHDFSLVGEKIDYIDKLDIEELITAYTLKDSNKLYDHFKKLIKISLSFSYDIALNYFMSEKPQRRLTEFTVIEWRRCLEELFINPIDNEMFELQYRTANLFHASIYNNNAIYIPSERILVNLIKRVALNLQKNKVPLPGHLLDYAARFESAVQSQNELNLDFIKSGLHYSFRNGEDFIFHSKKESIKLSESSSGIQSIVPLLLPLVDASQSLFHFSFVIEEPESNLYPKAQYDLLRFIEGGREDDGGAIDRGSIHTYTTHSPFILSGFNNMLYAFKKGDKAEKATKEKIASIIPKENWIDPENFSAYQIKDGKAESIVNRELGLIDETLIDQVSEEIIDDFRKIAIIASEK